MTAAAAALCVFVADASAAPYGGQLELVAQRTFAHEAERMRAAWPGGSDEAESRRRPGPGADRAATPSVETTTSADREPGDHAARSPGTAGARSSIWREPELLHG